MTSQKHNLKYLDCFIPSRRSHLSLILQTLTFGAGGTGKALNTEQLPECRGRLHHPTFTHPTGHHPCQPIPSMSCLMDVQLAGKPHLCHSLLVQHLTLVKAEIKWAAGMDRINFHYLNELDLKKMNGMKIFTHGVKGTITASISKTKCGFFLSEFLCKYVALLTVVNSQLLWECNMQGFVFYLRNIFNILLSQALGT